MTRQKLLLASTIIAGVATFAVGACAQDAGAAKKDAKKEEAATEVVVTGSRIRKSEFNSTSPVQVITSERSTLLGMTDIAKVLQGSTVAATSGQVNNNYTGYLVTGGPGVNTVSLRGLGANRTLVLLNGHRVGPAGVRGTVGPADLNTIPNSLVDRTDILKDGASSIYGSDAVAGVVNIITKKNYSGGDVKTYFTIPQKSGGAQYEVSLTQGIVQDKLHLSFAADYYKQEALTLGDRDWSKCPQDYVFDATTGERADLIDPKTGAYKCSIMTNARVDNLTSGRVYVFNDSAVANSTGYLKDDLNGLHRVSGTYYITPGGVITTASAGNSLYAPYNRASRSEAPVYQDKFLDTTVVSPVTRKSINLFGGYDLNETTEIYGEAMLNRRESSQHGWRQLFPQVDITNPNNPFRTGNTNGFPAGYARSIIALPSDADQQVSYSRFLGGIKGHFGDWGSLKNWTWDVYAQMSKSEGTYGGNFIYNDRVLATTAAGTVCKTSVLTTATACPTGGVNYFRRSTVETGQFTAEEAAFLFGYEQGKTVYKQNYIEADFSGDLFTVPAGTVSAALGFSYRTEYLNDQPGAQAAASNSWGLTTAGQTRGKDSIKEAFLEVAVPLVKDVFLIKKLDIDLSTRYSDYDSYGSNSTYKVGVNWALTNSLRLRGSQGTSFRAPALYELYLGNQTGFLGQSTIDPCYNLAAASNPSATVVANCAAQGIPTNYTATGSSSALIYSGGGKGILSAETSTNKTLGLIWTPSFSKIQVALDYFETEVNNQVSKFGSANILYQCYNSPNMSSPFCSLFQRDLTAGSTTQYNILTVHDNYLNVAQQNMRGYDLTLSYAHDFSFGKFRFDSQNSLIKDWTYTLLNGSAPQNQLGYTSAPEYVGNLDFRLDHGDYTFYWNVDMVGATDDIDYFGTAYNTNYNSTGQKVFLTRATKFYTAHTFTVRKKFDKWTLVGTISNLTDQDPPQVSTGVYSGRLGNAPLTSQYDQFGRTFTLSVQRKW